MLVGIDIIEIARVKETLARWGEKFLRRVFTEDEIKLYARKPQSLAARFAGKEAVMKLLGTGRRGVSWRDIEIVSHPGGRPLINLYGRAQNKANELGVKDIAVSISHSKEYAIVSAASSAGDGRR